MDAGADDYLTKPFSTGELLARIRVAMRHADQSTDEPIVTSGDLVVDIPKRRVTLAGRSRWSAPPSENGHEARELFDISYRSRRRGGGRLR